MCDKSFRYFVTSVYHQAANTKREEKCLNGSERGVNRNSKTKEALHLFTCKYASCIGVGGALSSSGIHLDFLDST